MSILAPGGTIPVDAAGRIAHPSESTATIEFGSRHVLPGFINAHSHAFQRLIRGRAESRATSGRDFWSWRGTMYHAAALLTPDDVYDVARMVFLEMLRSGITTVGEFHYLHTAPDGRPYADPNLLARKTIEAARSVGLRIVLLRAAYLRSGFELPQDPGQRRFFESVDDFLRNTALLVQECSGAPGVTIGVAPHSLRAVPLDALQAIVRWARPRRLPIHMHVSEQPAENSACVREYGVTPVTLLAREQLLGPDVTAVHAIHITDEEMALLAGAGAAVCSCPTTERNLGDGVLPALRLMRAGVPVALGTDSQAQIAPLEDARQLDYHLRLLEQERAVLDGIAGQPLAERLFACATRNGARTLGLDAGTLEPGAWADFVTLDPDDLSIAGASAEDALPAILFGMERTAIRDVYVGGRPVLQGGRHPLEEEIRERYKAVSTRVWRT